jgi:hypothetical protein
MCAALPPVIIATVEGRRQRAVSMQFIPHPGEGGNARNIDQ